MGSGMGPGWELIRAYTLDRARTPSLHATQHSLMQQFGLPAISPSDLESIGVPTALIWAGNGVPRLRMAVFSPDQVVIEDTWNVSGLSGTGSHHFRVDDVLVPSHRTLVPLVDEPCIDAVIARLPPPALLSLSIASIAVGIAQGALDDIIELATRKTPLLAEGTLARSANFPLQLADAGVALRAARALLYESAETVWATVAGGSPLSLHDRARVRAAAVWVTNRAAEVVISAYRAGGGSSVYASSPRKGACAMSTP